jgi:cytoskeletal protein RodZ
MEALSAVLSLSSVVVCSVVLLVVLGIAAMVWFWKRQPDQRTSANAPTPPIQSTIAHPTSGATPPSAQPVAPPPAAPAPPTAQPPVPPAEPPAAPPSADA